MKNFKNLLQNHCANFNQTWHIASLSGGDSSFLHMKDHLILKKKENGCFPLNQCYGIIVAWHKGVYWFKLVSQVSDVAHGPLVCIMNCVHKQLIIRQFFFLTGWDECPSQNSDRSAQRQRETRDHGPRPGEWEGTEKESSAILGEVLSVEKESSASLGEVLSVERYFNCNFMWTWMMQKMTQIFLISFPMKLIAKQTLPILYWQSMSLHWIYHWQFSFVW